MRRGALLLGLALALSSAAATGQAVAPAATKPANPAAAAPTNPAAAAGPTPDDGAREGYGATPAELQPYRASGAMAWRFYQQRQPWYGPRKARAAETTAQPVQGPWHIGLMIPALDAPDGELGESLRRAVTLRIDQANAGVDAPQWQLVLRHDSGAWGAAGNTLVDLAGDERLLAVIGSVAPASTHVALRVALKTELPLVNTASTDPTLTETAIPWIVRCYPDDRQHGYRLAQLVLERQGHRRPAVLRVNDKYGRMGVDEFRDAARRLGRPLVLEVRHERGETDFSRQVQTLTAMDADALVLWSPAEDAGRAVAALRAAGLNLPIYGTERLVSERFLAAAGAAAEGVLATTPLDPTLDSPAWTRFVADYRAAYDAEPDVFAAFAYDGASLLLQAIERSGPDRHALRDTLAALADFEGVSGPMHFDATLNNLGALHVVAVHDGHFVPWKEEG